MAGARAVESTFGQRILVVGAGALGGITTALLWERWMGPGSFRGSAGDAPIVALTTNAAIAQSVADRGFMVGGLDDARTVPAPITQRLSPGTRPFDWVVLAVQPPQVEQAEAELDAFLASIPAPTLQGTVRLGSPAHVILGVAREWDADLVVLGTHARRGMPRFFLGSVAETVLRKAPCSALVIPPAAVLSAGAEQEAGTAGPVAEREPTAEAR